MDLDFITLADRAAMAAFAHLNLDEGAFEISILACDDARIAALNADFRGKPQPTNVLSWPAQDHRPEQDGDRPALPRSVTQPGPDTELGDIAIAFETCEREAREAGRPFDHHVLHLVVHGILHLLGYDHIRDKDATLMEGIEVAILGKLGVDNPY